MTSLGVFFNVHFSSCYHSLVPLTLYKIEYTCSSRRIRSKQSGFTNNKIKKIINTFILYYFFSHEQEQLFRS